MNYNSIDEKKIRQGMEEVFMKAKVNTERRVKIFTGVAGYDMFDESLAAGFGFKRFYLPKKLARIFRRGNERVSPLGRNYRLIPNKSWKTI